MKKSVAISVALLLIFAMIPVISNSQNVLYANSQHWWTNWAGYYAKQVGNGDTTVSASGSVDPIDTNSSRGYLFASSGGMYANYLYLINQQYFSAVSCWNRIPIDISKPVDLKFLVKVEDTIADGMAFVLTPVSPSAGNLKNLLGKIGGGCTGRGGLGYFGNPGAAHNENYLYTHHSMAVTLDVWNYYNCDGKLWEDVAFKNDNQTGDQNQDYDYLATNEKNLGWSGWGGYFLATVLEFKYNPVTHKITVQWLDTYGNPKLTMNCTKDLASYFGTNTVYYGFTAGTGACTGRFMFKPVYKMVSTAHGSGTISPLGTRFVDPGGSKQFVIQADQSSGSIIGKILVDGSPIEITDNSNMTYTFNDVKEDHTIEAYFGYTIITSAEGPGTITPSGSVFVVGGESQSFTIKPSPDAFISKIIIDGEQIKITNTGKMTYTFSNVTSDHTIRAYFVRKQKSYPVTTAVASGFAKVVLSPSMDYVPEGSSVVVKIFPETGYHLNYIEDNGTMIPSYKLKQNPDGSYTYIIPGVYGPHTIKVYADINKYKVNVNCGEGGSVSPKGKVFSVNYGSGFVLTITPKQGYKVDKVTVNGKEIKLSNGNKLLLNNVKENCNIKIAFKKVSSPSSYASKVINLQINNPYIAVNGTKEKIDPQGSKPIIRNNRTLLPIRSLIEALGGTVEWNAEKREVTITLNGNTIVLTIGKNTALVNGIKTSIDPHNSNVVPIIINGRTYLPLRFIAEHLNCTVDWNPENREITIYYWG